MIMNDIVLDTNSLLMSVSSKSAYYLVWRSFLSGEYTLCISNDIIEEYYEVIARNLNPRLADAVIYTILTRKNVRKLDPHFRFHLITADEDDNKFVDCAIAANAKCIVTEDHHFSVLKTIQYPKVEVMSIDDFMQTLL
jgi:putative PIN family toxin of toxin-antitoxin system